jgi:amino acid transporter
MYQQANLALAYFLGIIVVGFGPTLIYSLWTLGMPRSGGEYVWLSRLYHPMYGFIVNWFLTFVFLSWFGLNCATVGPFFLGSVFTSLGMNGLATAVSSTTGAMAIGIVAAILFGAMVFLGMRAYAWFQKIVFWGMVAGFLVFVALALSTSNSAFIDGFNRYVANSGGNLTYSGVLDKARGVGWVPGWTLSATGVALVFPLQNYSWAGFPAYVSGEIRDIRRSTWVAFMGGLLVMGAWFVVTGLLLYNTVGYNFLHGLAYLWNSGSSAYPLPFPPYPQNFAFFMTDNRIVIAIVAITWLLSGIYLTPPNLLLATRNVFAWSFDRLLPTTFAKVDERFAAPTYAILACTIVGILLTIFTVIASYAVMIINTFMVLEAVLGLVAIAAIVFPFAKKDYLNKMPAIVARKIFGVPIMTLAGIVMLATSIAMIYAAYSAPSLGLWNSTSLMFNIAVLVAAIPIYLAAYFYRKSKGFDLTLQFREVPPD